MTAGDAASGSVKWRWAVLALVPWAALVAVGTTDPWLSRIPGTEIRFVKGPGEGPVHEWHWYYNGSVSDVSSTEASPTSALGRACGTGLDSYVHWIPFGDRAVGWCRAEVVLLEGPPGAELSDEQVRGAFTPRPSVRAWAGHPVAVREVTPGELMIAWIGGSGDYDQGVDHRRVHVGLYDEQLKPLGPVQTFVAPHTVGAVFVGARLGLTQIDAANTSGRMSGRDEDFSPPRLSFLVDTRDGTVRRVGRLRMLRPLPAIGASVVTLTCLLLSLGMVHRRHALVRALRGQTARIISAADAHGGLDGTVTMTTAVGVLRFRRRHARSIGFAKGRPTDGPCPVVLAALPALGGAPFRDHPLELDAKERPIVVRGDGVAAVREAERLRRLAIRNAAIGIGAAALPLLLATF